MSQEEKYNPGLYYTVIDGTFRTRVTKDHPEAKAREYETADGAKAIKYERVVSALSGFIQDIAFFEGDYGKTVNIKLDENERGESPIIQLNVATTYGEDFLKKIPNVDFSKEVRLQPFAFTDENGRDVRGITITQDGVKLKNFFFDSEKKVSLNGYPEPEGDRETYSNEDWKIHFLKARKFLINYTLENVIPKIQKRAPLAAVEDINPADIPF